MNEEEFLKAIKCTKEELIEWLNEIYKDEKENREIILKYEKLVGAKIYNREGKTMVEIPGYSYYYRKGW